ncbi:hypothetical protein AGMMS49975_20030 [Clostridia bacterium]|nr:hypothetical protein AGMMS49975_20030 [Clostridia bacterium]
MATSTFYEDIIIDDKAADIIIKGLNSPKYPRPKYNGEFERGAGTIKITSVNIGEIRNTDVEVSFITAMNNFSCKDMNVEDFLKNKALDFDARNVARTYLLIDEEQYLRRVIIILAYTNPWRSF